MRLILKRYELLTVCILMFTLFSAASYAAPMKIVYYDDYAPRSFVKDGKVKGILIDIANEALAKRMGIEVLHEGYPWQRAQSMVKNGLADAFITVPTDERKEYTKASSEPVLVFETFLATVKNNPKIDEMSKITSLEELKPYSLVDYHSNGWAQSALKDLNVTWLPDYQAIFHFLEQGKADAVVVSRKAIHTIEHLGFKDDIVIFENPLTSIKFHLCINTQSEYVNILEKFDKVIREMKESHIIDKIISSYY